MIDNCNRGSRKGFRQHHISETAGFKPQKRLYPFLLHLSAILISLFALTGTSLAETFVSGNITSDTTWGVAGSPYIVTGDITVYHTSRTNGEYFRKLTIEPGVEVRFNPGTGLVHWQGLQRFIRLLWSARSAGDRSSPHFVHIQFDQCPAGRLERYLFSQPFKGFRGLFLSTVS